jgi:hypothetical protein
MRKKKGCPDFLFKAARTDDNPRVFRPSAPSTEVATNMKTTKILRETNSDAWLRRQGSSSFS